MYTLTNEERMDLIYQNYRKNSIYFDFLNVSNRKRPGDEHRGGIPRQSVTKFGTKLRTAKGTESD
jgi:hypothetical protein